MDLKGKEKDVFDSFAFEEVILKILKRYFHSEFIIKFIFRFGGKIVK